MYEKVNPDQTFINAREVQALGAVYTLIDYVAGRIAEIGETPEGENL